MVLQYNKSKHFSTMNIQLWSKIKNSSVPVLFLKNKGKAKEHHFFKLLSEGDKNYIGRFLNKNSDDEFSRSLLLPSGKKAIVILVKENKGKFPLRKTIISMRRIILLARKEKIKDIAVNLNDFLPTTNYKL